MSGKAEGKLCSSLKIFGKEMLARRKEGFEGGFLRMGWRKKLGVKKTKRERLAERRLVEESTAIRKMRTHRPIRETEGNRSVAHVPGNYKKQEKAGSEN